MEKRNIRIIQIPFSPEDREFIHRGIEEVLDSGYLTEGKKVEQFEEEFAKFVGCKHAIAVNSCTSAMEIALRIKEIEGKTIIIPSNTFISSASSVLDAGGKIAFCDCDPKNLCIDLADFKRKVEQYSPVGVTVVHIGGIISPYFDEIKEICDDNNMFILEDAAHAHGATFKGRMAGNLGLAAGFSWYPTKVLTTGEGGTLTTNDKELCEAAKCLRDYGRSAPGSYKHIRLGSNWKISEITAVFGIQQTRKAPEILEERRRIAKSYDEKLQNIPGLGLVQLPPHVKSSYYKYIVFFLMKNREDVKAKMKEMGVSLTGEVYTEPLHTQTPLQKHPRVLNWKESFPKTEYIAAKHACLPDYPGLTEADIEYIVECLKRVLK
jgi:dTDP-4-amino-4,6-dideoxygalactose transaminase